MAMFFFVRGLYIVILNVSNCIFICFKIWFIDWKIESYQYAYGHLLVLLSKLVVANDELGKHGNNFTIS